MKFFFCFLSVAAEGRTRKRGTRRDRAKGWPLDNFMSTNVLHMQVPLQCHDTTTGYVCYCARRHVHYPRKVRRHAYDKSSDGSCILENRGEYKAARTEEVCGKWFKGFLLVKSLVTVARYFSAPVANVRKLFGGSIRVHLTSQPYAR